MNWIWQLALGMISAWIVMSVWFWKLLWHILAVSFEWTCNKVFHGSIQETWRDEDESAKYIKPAKTAKVRREYVKLEPIASKPQSPPKIQKQKLPEDLSTLSREELTELFKTHDVSVMK